MARGLAGNESRQVATAVSARTWTALGRVLWAAPLPSLLRHARTSTSNKPQALFEALKSGDEDGPVALQVGAPALPWQAGYRGESRNARARRRPAGRRPGNGFEDWAHLVAFADAVRRDDTVGPLRGRGGGGDRAGTSPCFASMLAAHPELARARSTRRHHATLLHYIAANGVEGYRQITPAERGRGRQGPARCRRRGRCSGRHVRRQVHDHEHAGVELASRTHAGLQIGARGDAARLRRRVRRARLELAIGRR